MSATNDLKRMKPEQIKMYKESFSVFDEDDNGRVDVDEYYDKMVRLNQNVNKLEFVDLLRSTDPDGDDEINIAEYMVAMAKRKPRKETKEDKKLGAEIFDISGNDVIDKNDLIDTMEICGLPLSEKEVEAIFKVHDNNDDEHLSVKEFIGMMDFAEKIILKEGFDDDNDDDNNNKNKGKNNNKNKGKNNSKK